LTDQQRVWESWARADPYWAILSDPARKGGAWDLEAFFGSGVRDVQVVLGQLEERGIEVVRGRCLDFGCGVGRLSQALAEEFEHVDGVDISETMIRLANEHNRYGDRCSYHVNQSPDLRLFADGIFDFIFTTIVLQHNPPDMAERYIRELVRILRIGGAAVFDMPTGVRGRALPKGSHVASLQVMSSPRRMAPGGSGSFSVRVTNSSDQDWPSGSRLSLGNHWLSNSGEMLVQDDGRQPVEGDVAAGASRRLELSVRAPERPGRYLLVLDLVEEQVCWFADRGSTVVEVPVRVGNGFLRGRSRNGAARSGEQSAPDPEPFGMHGLPVQRVEQAVTESGGEVVDAVANDTGGAHFDVLRYFVVRR
jgi:SAM-dependent methyltransferase